MNPARCSKIIFRLWPIRILGIAALLFGLAWGQARSVASEPATMPEFTNQSAQAWINSRPLQQATLRGKVVLLDVFSAD